MELNLDSLTLIACVFIVCFGFVYLMVRIMYSGPIKIDESIGRKWNSKIYCCN